MIELFLALSMQWMEIPEPEPPDPLEGVLWVFPINKEEAWARWRHIAALKSEIEKHSWKFRPEEYRVLVQEIKYRYAIYDAMTDVYSTACFEKRASAVEQLKALLGDRFYQGWLPEEIGNPFE